MLEKEEKKQWYYVVSKEPGKKGMSCLMVKWTPLLGWGDGVHNFPLQQGDKERKRNSEKKESI